MASKQTRARSRTVWTVFWDSPCCGIGAGYAFLKKRGGRYYYSDTDGAVTTRDLGGPWDDLDEAVKAGSMAVVTSVTCSITSTEKTAWEIAALLTVDDPNYFEDGQPLMLNDELFVYDGGKFRPATPREAGECGAEGENEDEEAAE
jgi:hypothetical protein